jgi:hypothetical protein
MKTKTVRPVSSKPLQSKFVSCYPSAFKNSLGEFNFVEAIKMMVDQRAPSNAQQIKIEKQKRIVHGLDSHAPEYRLAKDKLDKLKAQIFCMLPYGVCKNGRSDNGVSNYTGVMFHDIDGIWDKEELDRIIDVLRTRWPHALLIKRSLSGTGLHVFSLTDAKPEQHKATWEKIRTLLILLIDHDVDNATFNLSRLCFASRDPKAFINWEPEVFKVVEEIKAKEKIAAAIDRFERAEINLNEVGVEMINKFEPDGSKKNVWKTFVICPYKNHNKKNHCVAFLNADDSIVLKCFGGECQLTIEAFNFKLADVVKKQQISVYTTFSLEEIIAFPIDEKANYMGDRVICKGERVVIVGPPEIGKSRIILELAAQMYCGLPFYGQIETRAKGLGPWLILQTENSRDRIQSDVHALIKIYGDDWLNNVFIQDIVTDDDGYVDLAVNLEKFRATIRQREPKFMVLDPLPEFQVEDLKSDFDLRRTFSLIEHLHHIGNPDRVMIIVAHSLTGKSGISKSFGYEKLGFPRGSKRISGWARTIIAVNPGSGEDNPPRVISCLKNSRGFKFPRFALGFDPSSLAFSHLPNFDFDAWERDINMDPTKQRQERVGLDELDDMEKVTLSHNKMIKEIEEHVLCSKQVARRLLKEGLKEKVFTHNKKDGSYTKNERSI